jgi:hypothetical protein
MRTRSRSRTRSRTRSRARPWSGAGAREGRAEGGAGARGREGAGGCRAAGGRRRTWTRPASPGPSRPAGRVRTGEGGGGGGCVEGLHPLAAVANGIGNCSGGGDANTELYNYINYINYVRRMASAGCSGPSQRCKLMHATPPPMHARHPCTPPPCARHPPMHATPPLPRAAGGGCKGRVGEDGRPVGRIRSARPARRADPRPPADGRRIRQHGKSMT